MGPTVSETLQEVCEVQTSAAIILGKRKKRIKKITSNFVVQIRILKPPVYPDFCVHSRRGTGTFPHHSVT